MAGLLADGWFYISSAGLLVSGVLFFFLLGQYRAAAEAADQPEPEAAAEPHAVVRPVYIPEDTPAPAKVASVVHEDKPAEKPAEKTAPAATPAPAPAPAAATPDSKRRENTTGGINPAVVYLQNIKNQLEEIHKENKELAKRVEAITSRDEALIERLSELAQAVAELKSAAPAAAPAAEPAPAPKRAKKAAAEPAPAAAPVAEPAVVVEAVPAPAPEPAAAPAPEPAPAPAPATPPTLTIEPTTAAGVSGSKKNEPTAETLFNPDETMRLNLKPAEEAKAAPAETKPAAEPAEEPEADKPRRGPVWPV